MTRVVVIGAGSLGTAYGACLARGGAEVQLLAREAHARAIQEAGGVRLDTGGETAHLPLAADWRPERIAPADVAILLTKAHDGAAALAPLGHLLDELQIAVSLQNGIGKDAVLAGWCGAERVIGGVSMVGATLHAPGHVALTSAGATYLGELPAGTSTRVEHLAAVLSAGGLQVVVADRILDAEWSKLVHAAPVMTLTALSRLPFHAALLDDDLRELYVRLVREGAALAAAAGAGLADLPGLFPVQAIAAAGFEEAGELVRQRGLAMVAAGAKAVRISMLEDVARGRRLELDDVHGHLTAEAARLGVDAPLSRVSLDLLLALDTTRTEAPWTAP